VTENASVSLLSVTDTATAPTTAMSWRVVSSRHFTNCLFLAAKSEITRRKNESQKFLVLVSQIYTLISFVLLK